MKRPLSLFPSHGFRRNSRRPVSLVVGVATALLAGIALVIASPLAPASPVSANGGCAEEAIPAVDGVFQVSTPGQLLSLANTSNTASLSATYVQTEDIDLSSCGNWLGIGDTNHPFTGSYNGGGYTISNVTITVSTGGRGFFNQTSGSAISSLSLDSVTISGGTSNQVGGLIGVAVNTSVSSATVSALTVTGLRNDIGGLIGILEATVGTVLISGISVSAEMKDGQQNRVGGVIGHLKANAENVSVYVSDVIARVDITANLSDAPIQAAGGLIGRIDYDNQTARVFLQDLFVEGSVRSGSSTRSGSKVGGLIGFIDSDSGQILISSAEADVSVSATGDYVGGLIGHLYPGSGSTVTLSSTVALGDVAGGDKVGGLVGWLDLASNSRAVIVEGTASGDVIGGEFDDAYGGLVGSVEMSTGSEAVIYASHAFGNVRTLDNRVGGLIGEIAGTRGVLTITKSSASGEVEGQDFVGGLIGFIRNRHVVRILDSFATGDVAGSAASSTVGGLIGSQDHLDSSVNPAPVPDAETTIARTYSTGSVTGTGNLGGLIGLSSDATVCASFWDLNTSGQATSAGGSGAVGKSTADMKKLSTFSGAGWSIGSGSGDSSKIWGITENTSYPFLIWPTQGVSGDCEQSGTGTGTGGVVESVVESTVPPTTVPPSSVVPVPVSVGGVLPALAPGEVVVYEDGVPVVVEVYVEDDTELVVLASTFELRLSGECSEGCTIAAGDDGRETLTLEQEGVANVTGVGFEPGSSVFVWLFSEPRFLGELTVNADGTFAGSVALGDVEIGEHTLQVNGVSQQGSERSANLGVVVNPEGVVDAVLPSTGGDQNLMVWLLTVLLLVLGVGLTRVARRPVVVR
jgi:hypothetical protein